MKHIIILAFLMSTFSVQDQPSWAMSWKGLQWLQGKRYSVSEESSCSRFKVMLHNLKEHLNPETKKILNPIDEQKLELDQMHRLNQPPAA